MTTSITGDRDYLELYLSGETTVSTGSSDADADPLAPDSGSVTITHNLGEVPFVRIYSDPQKNGRLYGSFPLKHGASVAFDKVDPYVTVVNTTTTTKIILNSIAAGAQSNIPVHYRIYRFGDKSITGDKIIDKIFSHGESSATIGSSAAIFLAASSSETIPHGQGEQVLATLQFSVDQTNWFPGGTRLIGGTSGSNYYYHSACAYTTSSNVVILYEHNYASSQTIYVRYVLDYK